MSATVQMYAYTAKDDRTGRPIKGKMDGDSVAAVRATLRARGATPVSITSTRESIWTRDFTLGKAKKIKLKELAAMTRKFATMLNSDVKLLPALDTLVQQADNDDLRRALRSVRNSVESGSSLSEALSKHTDVFPPLMVHLTRAGEEGGFLDVAMLRISNMFESDMRLIARIKSAVTYPGVVAAFAVVALVGVLVWLVPVFERLYKDLGGDLPFITQMLVNISQGFKTGLPIIIAGMVLGGWWWQRNRYRQAVREVIDPIKLKLPVFGPLFHLVAMSRFARNLGTLMHSGVTLNRALVVVAATTGSVAIAGSVDRARERVIDGASLSEALNSEGDIFEPMIPQMIAVGEGTGKVDELLDKVADFYDHEVEHTAAALTSLIEPFMTVAVAAAIGAMVFALYWPVFSIFDLIQ